MLQFLVDISTPASVLESVSQAVQAHMDANSTEYKAGSLTVSFSSNDDPLKVQLVVSFEYSHNGNAAVNMIYPRSMRDLCLLSTLHCALVSAVLSLGFACAGPAQRDNLPWLSRVCTSTTCANASCNCVLLSAAGVDGKRTEKARCGLLIIVCQSLVKLKVVHTSAPSFPYPNDGLDVDRTAL